MLIKTFICDLNKKKTINITWNQLCCKFATNFVIGTKCNPLKNTQTAFGCKITANKQNKMHIIYAQTEIIQLSQEKYHKYVELSQDNVHYPIIT